MRKRRITIQDIADELDTTASTVSRALQDHPRISDATKESVRKMAEKLNYKPNNVASALRSGKSNVIGIMIPRTDRFFFASIVRGIDTIASNAGYKIIISQSSDSTRKEETNITTLLEARVDGILASYALGTHTFEHYKQIIDENVPLILFDRTHETLESLHAAAVVLDDYLGAFKATEHLIKQGCRQIIHFAGPQHVSIYKERRRGYEEALKRHDISVDDTFILESDVKREAGKELGKKLMDANQLPDAIFSASDYAAATAMKVLKEYDIKVPDEVAVVGFGNEPFTSFINLTTVDQHAEEMGRMAAQLFLDQINGKNINQSRNKTVINPDLIVRESSLKSRE
jgi:LacI family transcriptional regulator